MSIGTSTISVNKFILKKLQENEKTPLLTTFYSFKLF
jgi:hypothetical protein